MNIPRGKIFVELYLTFEKVTFYTIRLGNNKLSETEQFFQKNNTHKLKEDLMIVVQSIKKMGNETGALERKFRPEGKMKDRLAALPLFDTKLRLYALRISEDIVILGNGGFKTTDTYQKDAFLNSCAITLQALDEKLKIAIKNGTVKVDVKKLTGKLDFVL